MGIVHECTETIDGITYTTHTLPATVGLSVMPRLVALLGDKILPLMFEAGVDGIEELFKDPKILAVFISNISERITQRRAEGEADPTDVLRDIMLKTEADKVRIGTTTVRGSVYQNFDDHFAGNYTHLLKVVGWLGQVNFVPPSAESP
jgi:hypothetical protein